MEFNPIAKALWKVGVVSPWRKPCVKVYPLVNFSQNIPKNIILGRQMGKTFWAGNHEFREKLALLDKALERETPESLLRKLQSYPAYGPPMNQFL